MGRIFAKIFKFFLVVALIAGGGYLVLQAWPGLEQQIVYSVAPCSRPLQYSLGSFDPRFRVSEDQFLAAAAKAAGIWNKSLSKTLLEYSPAGPLKVNLIYDYRQEATDKLRQLGIVINDDKSTYDTLQQRYQTMKAKYDRDLIELTSVQAAYEKEKNAYEAEVEKWNQEGGAPSADYARLTQEKISLQQEAAQINQQQVAFNNFVGELNAVVNVLNRLVAELNLNVGQFNNIGQQRGAEFQEGVYQTGNGAAEIDIYQFDNTDQLVRLLAHEFGHALGLGHVNDPQAIMYRLNEGKNEKPTAADLQELRQQCRVVAP